MLAGTSDVTYQGTDGGFQEDQSLTLFVGCLDPQTTKEDLILYFKHFDPWIRAKLIVNFKTGQSKQCGLLFCSSPVAVKNILQADHCIRQRRVRVNPAQTEYKGTKINELFQVQISGLDPDVTSDCLTDTFSYFKGFSKARLVQGLHPKQKKVAIIYFEEEENANTLLQYSHVKVGQRSCKVSPYHKDTNSIASPKSAIMHQEPLNKYSSQSFGQQMANCKKMHSQPQIGDTPKTHASESSLSRLRPLSPLRLVPLSQFQGRSHFNSDHENPKTGPQAFVLPVEAEKDSLYRIFCLPPPPQFERKEDPALKISAESKETRDE